MKLIKLLFSLPRAYLYKKFRTNTTEVVTEYVQVQNTEYVFACGDHFENMLMELNANLYLKYGEGVTEVTLPIPVFEALERAILLRCTSYTELPSTDCHKTVLQFPTHHCDIVVGDYFSFKTTKLLGQEKDT